MSPIYFVMVRRCDERYIDSVWLLESNAAKRLATVYESLNRAGFNSVNWRAWVSEALLEDGKVETAEQ